MILSRALRYFSIGLLLSTKAYAQAISTIPAKQVQLLPAIPPLLITHSKSDSLRNRPFTYRDNRIPQPLFVVNGKLIAYEELAKIDPQRIKDLTIVKGHEAIKLFGANGSNGVIILTMEKRHLFRHKKSPLK